MSDSQQIPSPPPYAPELDTPAPQAKNLLGLISLIAGIVAFVGAFVPVLNYLTGIIAIGGIVVGVMALLKKDKPRKAALTGTIVSSVALILSIVLAVVYTGVIIRAVDEAQGGISVSDSEPDAGSSADETDDEAAEPADDAVGTRGNPAPLGTIVKVSDDQGLQYEITLNATILNANDVVATENEYSEAAPEGMQYAMVSVTAAYKGSDSGSPSSDVDIAFVSAAGTTHSSYDTYVYVEPSLSSIRDLYTDASGTGSVVVSIPTADVEAGTWVVSSYFNDSKFFYAAQ